MHHARTRSTTLLTASLATLAAVLVAPPAGAAPTTGADEWDVTGAAVVRVLGHGYGHGHGMSQYGAEGAARAGLSARQIAEFYYPGTQWGSATGRVQVHLTRDTTDDVVVRARRGLKVRSLTRQKTWTLPDRKASQWRLEVDGKNRTAVQWRGRRGWKTFRAFRGDAEFSAAGGVDLVTPSGTVTYRGKLRSAAPSPDSRSRDTVNILSLENYLRGVVPLEMPASWSPEAVRAQAIAARTYAAYERAHPLARHYQICDTTQCQVYGGRSAEHPASDAAIAATAGQVLTADGEPAFTQFNASSGGWTSAGSVPYLVAREDPYDGWAGNPVHRWELSMGDDRLERTWPKIGDLTRLVVHERDGNGEWGGRVRRMTLVGDRGQVTVTGDQVRSALGLRSTWFTFEVVPKVNRRAW